MKTLKVSGVVFIIPVFIFYNVIFISFIIRKMVIEEVPNKFFITHRRYAVVEIMKFEKGFGNM